MASLPRPQAFRTLTLPLRPSPQHQSACNVLPHQCRQASSTRRARKMLNIPPSPVQGGPILPTGSSGRSRTAKVPLPTTDHIVFNPPSSAPNVYHTPIKFLPKSDVRWKLQNGAAQSKQTATQETESATSLASFGSGTSQMAQMPVNAASLQKWPEAMPLPPPVRKPYEKQYHLGPDQIEEIRRLRREDENKWTRSALAQRFQCSQWFIGLVEPASEERKARLRGEEEAFLRTWKRRGVVSLKTRKERRKRKALWGVEA